MLCSNFLTDFPIFQNLDVLYSVQLYTNEYKHLFINKKSFVQLFLSSFIFNALYKNGYRRLYAEHIMCARTNLQIEISLNL